MPQKLGGGQDQNLETSACPATFPRKCHEKLVGGLEHVLFSNRLEIIIPIDFHIFQRGRSTTNHIHRLAIDYP